MESRNLKKEFYDTQITEPEFGTYIENSFFREKQWAPGVFGSGRQRFAADMQKNWTFFLFIVAFIAMAVTCLRLVRARTLSGGAGRQLAERLRDDEATREAVLEMCLDMEEEAGLLQHTSTSLADPRTAIAGILQSLTSYSEPPSQSIAPPRQPGGLPPSEASESTAPLSSPMSLPSTSGGTSIAAEGVGEWHATGPQEKAAVQGQKRGRSTQGSYGPEIPVKAARVQQLLEHYAPKKHTSGWKRRGPSQPLGASYPLSEQQPREDPLIAASQAVRTDLPPDPLDTGGGQSEQQQESGHEEEDESEVDPLLRAMEAVQKEVSSPELELPLLAEGLPAATGAASSSSYAFPALPIPSTSQAFAFTPASQTEDSLPGPSRAAPAAASPPSGLSMQPPSAAPLPGPAPPMPSHTHLFYRLPVLLPGVTSRKFSFGRAVTVFRHAKKSYPNLASARGLLAKSELTQEEASHLIANAEALVGHLVRAHRQPVSNIRPNRAFEQLAYRYLMMEAVFCAIQVLGPQMDAVNWWPHFTSMIPSEFNYNPATITRDHTYYNAVLGKRLSRALASLKGGIRPTLEETVHLKRALLCSDSSYSKFKHSKWEPWRQADAISRGASGD